MNQTEENEMYLLNNNNNNNNPYDYYHRQFSHPANRGSFSSVSSHHSYLYPTLNHEDNDTSKASSVATPTSYHLDNHTISNNNNNNNNTHHHHNNNNNNNSSSSSSSSRLANEKYIYSTTYTKYNQPEISTDTTTEAPVIHRTTSPGSTTPSSWFSPETPTAVLFQQKDKEEVVTSNKRKPSMDAASSSPTLRATRRQKVVKLEQD
jgi:hypothetical protein